MILAIETSCDDTCAAIVTPEGEIRANVISSQGIHDRYGGVVPEIASRQHLELVGPVVEDALRRAEVGLSEIDRVAVTQGPGLVGALLVGLTTAKALAAGGGDVTITYAVGREEAERVATEIQQWGGKCKVIPYNVLPPSPELPAIIASELTHAYYFATPGIARAKRPLFDPATFALFQRFYIDGFLDLCRKIARRANPVQVFYPSTVFVAERPKEFAEYAMAKAAGEILCADLNRSLPGIRVFSTRLPRLETDQSPDSVLTENADIFEIMLPLIRAMQSEAALPSGE